MKLDKFLLDVYENHKGDIDQLSGFSVIEYINNVFNKLKVVRVDWDALSKLYGDQYNYVAMDEDGAWRAYETKPKLHLDGYWVANDNVEDYENMRHNDILDYDKNLVSLDELDWFNTLFIKGEQNET